MSHVALLRPRPHDAAPDRAVALHPPAPATTRFVAAWARPADEVAEAQRLRWRVFVDEMGARPQPLPGTPPQHDADRFDAFCEHLLVRVADGPCAGLLVGTYRVLVADAARRAGGFYSDGEFDLQPVRALLLRAAELGRSCVHPEWRSGGAILALWGALYGFLERHRIEVVIGCASVGIGDGGHHAASLWRRLRETHLVDAALRVAPRLPLPLAHLRDDLDAEPPALVKGYLRCGGRLLGPPAWDPDFNAADLPLMLRLADFPSRYQRHFADPAG
ncbi:MAG: ornithine-acyl-ACP acyltransferase [Rubrivivax sp. SCN 71-131]|nr:MAG: ornithine-acyl-ACP acyltransferase [Rubrivivax sp. SCN 71-131]